MQKKCYGDILKKVHRKMAIRVCRAYRTISYEAATVLASVPPIHLLIWERSQNYISVLPKEEARKNTRERLLIRWQAEWESGRKGEWTRTLISNLITWCTRRHGEMDYYLTQALSGHGGFKAYSMRIQKTEDNHCMYCGQPDTVHHTLFECQRWERARTQLNISIVQTRGQPETREHREIHAE